MLDSLNVQTYKNFELIIIDGSSEDNTLGIINEYSNRIDIKKFISKIPGIFPSLNLGLKKVSGDIIFILHADNYLSNKDVFQNVINEFKNDNIDVLFASVLMFHKFSDKILRIYRSNNFKKWMIRVGHMPPHSGCFIKKNIKEDLGYYDETFKVASDFDYIIRIIISKKKYKIKYSEKIYTNVMAGGVSNSGLKSIFFNTFELNKIMKKNRLYTNYLILLLRIPIKILQFLKSK